MIPITLHPKEKKTVHIVFRSNECLEFNSEFTVKSITGKICNKEYRIPYHVVVKKCPLKFSAMKIDFPVL